MGIETKAGFESQGAGYGQARERPAGSPNEAHGRATDKKGVRQHSSYLEERQQGAGDGTQIGRDGTGDENWPVVGNGAVGTTRDLVVGLWHI